MATLQTKTTILAGVSEEDSHTRSLVTASNAVQPQASFLEAELLAKNLRLAPVHRLIVLIPDLDVDEAEISKRIWELASPPGLTVIFFGLCGEIVNEARIHRRLITLANLTREPRVSVDAHVEFGKNWLRGVQKILQDGDVVVCSSETKPGFARKSLSRVFETAHIPVWTLDELYQPIPIRRGWMAGIIFWVVSLAILLGFFWLQIQITQLANDWVQSTYLLLTIIVEIGVIWGWHVASS
jgi:hypothetical protein